MQRGQLSDYFEGVGVKRLSAVDAEPKTSNQHEVGTQGTQLLPGGGGPPPDVCDHSAEHPARVVSQHDLSG